MGLEKIRQEKPHDFNEIYQLVKAAFETAKVKDGDGQDYVNKLRNCERYIPELALVAAEKGMLVGHIMLTKTQIVSGNKNHTEFLLSPLCVALTYRNEGVGGALINKVFGWQRRWDIQQYFYAVIQNTINGTAFSPHRNLIS